MLRKKIRSYFWLFLLVAGLGGCGAGDVTVTPTKTLTAISVTPVNSAIAKNTGQQYSATGIYSDNTTQDLTASVTWISSDTNTAVIDVPGHVIGKNVGSSVIKASYGNFSDDAVLNVTDATLVSITVTPTNPSIAKGSKQQFTATGTYSDNTTQNLTTTAIWISSSTGVATISNASGSNGLATSVAAGTTTITVTSGSISGSTTLTVTGATLVSITVTPTNPSIAKGTKQQFTATGIYSDNTTQNLTTTAIWISSSTGVATISNASGSNGLATSVAAGTTTVTATSGSISGSTALTVTGATLVSITVTPTNPSIAKGTKQQFTATGTYADNTTQNLTNAAIWSSSGTGVATISNASGSSGLATSVAAGTTTITATSGGISGSTALTVTAATLTSIAVTPKNPSIANGATQQFKATGTYSDNTTQDLTDSATWSSSSAGVATVSNAAGSKGLATAVAVGATTITSASGSVSASTTLTVIEVAVVTLGWNAPTTNEDGSPVSLSGYKIYYGTSSGAYTKSVGVASTGATSVTYTLSLSPGTYYFAVTAVSTDGQESAYSNEVSKTL